MLIGDQKQRKGDLEDLRAHEPIFISRAKSEGGREMGQETGRNAENRVTRLPLQLGLSSIRTPGLGRRRGGKWST